MNIKFFIFPTVAGVVMALSGANIVEQPIKTIFLLAVLCYAHEITKGEQA